MAFTAFNKSEIFRSPKNTEWDMYRKIVIGNLNRLEKCDSISELEEQTRSLTFSKRRIALRACKA